MVVDFLWFVGYNKYVGDDKMINLNDGFSKYLVIFVDLLGTKNKDENDFQETYRVNKIFYDEMKSNQYNDMDHTAYERHIYTFSDCAYILYSFKKDIEESRKDEGKLFTVALCNCTPIFLAFLNNHILFRGGIYYGNAFLDAEMNMFFGPAINNAYKLESEQAIHPRIVIDKYVAEITIENIRNVKYHIINNQPEYFLAFPEQKAILDSKILPKMPITGDGIVELDLDDKYIFNYLHPLEYNSSFPNITSSNENLLYDLLQFCNDQIKMNNKYRIIDKYFYLQRYIEQKFDRISGHSDEPLEQLDESRLKS